MRNAAAPEERSFRLSSVGEFLTNFSTDVGMYPTAATTATICISLRAVGPWKSCELFSCSPYVATGGTCSVLLHVVKDIHDTVPNAGELKGRHEHVEKNGSPPVEDRHASLSFLEVIRRYSTLHRDHQEKHTWALLPACSVGACLWAVNLTQLLTAIAVKDFCHI